MAPQFPATPPDTRAPAAPRSSSPHGPVEAAASRRSAIRVRSVPAGHPYVRHATAAAPGVLVLDDPVLGPHDPARWWPHPVLEAAEQPDVLDGADLVHVHFGYEHRTPEQVARFVTAVRARGLPLVVTVHDLSNPHEPDPAAHLERTGHLVRGADTVVTLTPGAAVEIRQRWGVDAVVIPHPRLMPASVTEPHRRRRLERAGRTGRAGSAGSAGSAAQAAATVGVVLGSLRAGTAAEELLPPLVSALPRGARLVVMVRADALRAARDPAHPRNGAAVQLDRLVGAAGGEVHDAVPVSAEGGGAERPRVEVRAHDHLDDDELCAALTGFDALLLPHRHGTHSGWLELCRDLGLPPIIPRIGHLAEQWGGRAPTYVPEHPGSDSLHPALTAALSGPLPPPRRRDADDAAVADAHAELYRAVLAGSPR